MLCTNIKNTDKQGPYDDGLLMTRWLAINGNLLWKSKLQLLHKI